MLRLMAGVGGEELSLESASDKLVRTYADIRQWAAKNGWTVTCLDSAGPVMVRNRSGDLVTWLMPSGLVVRQGIVSETIGSVRDPFQFLALAERLLTDPSKLDFAWIQEFGTFCQRCSWSSVSIVE